MKGLLQIVSRSSHRTHEGVRGIESLLTSSRSSTKSPLLLAILCYDIDVRRYNTTNDQRALPSILPSLHMNDRIRRIG